MNAPVDATALNVKQAVPFFMVLNLARSLAFYRDRLGFVLKNQWVVKGEMLWCWIELGAAALMLQEMRHPDPHSDAWQEQAQTGIGVTICFQCEDALALYRSFRVQGVEMKTPFVGNSMWVVGLTDPDGYRLSFESPTDAPEETLLNETH